MTIAISFHNAGGFRNFKYYSTRYVAVYLRWAFPGKGSAEVGRLVQVFRFIYIYLQISFPEFF